MEKYTNRMVIIHWLTLVLLVMAWLLGDFLDEAREEDGASLAGYVAHALVGGVILLLTVVRLVLRGMDGVPPPLGNTPMDKVAKGIHHLLYTMLFLVPVSGMMQVLTSDVGKALMAWDVSLLPKEYHGLFAHEAHEVLVNVLIVLVLIHVLGALKHQFMMKDNLLARMSMRKD